jgi:MoaA/NifB/PqqE/SkfB family radical SAM enzyme
MAKYYDYNDINFIDLEMTNFCNASCGACDRNINGGEVRQGLKLSHMTDGTWDAFISNDNLKNIKKITLDGNVGDASMHPNLINMLDKLAGVNPNLFLEVRTNGGARTPQFWKDLSAVLKRFKSHRVTFAIDGLEDTNHIYRRNVNWEKLIENVNAFNEDPSSVSIWRCIIFDHNKHQIDDMINLANNLGFSGYKTQRNRVTPITLQSYKKLPGGVITSPTRAEFIEKYNLYKQFKDNYKITEIENVYDTAYDCPFGQQRLVSMDVDGKVWPCCHIYSNYIVKYTKFPWEVWEDNIDINTRDLKQILQFIQETLYDNWEKDENVICKNCSSRTNSAL